MHNANRSTKALAPVVLPLSVAPPAPAASRFAVLTQWMPSKMVVAVPSPPRGFLPLALYQAASVVFPLLLFYVTFDFADNVVRGVFIGASALYALFALTTMDCCIVYNMLLGFHTGVEVKVIETALDYAMAAATPDYGVALGYAGAVVVIAHLVPFFVWDGPKVVALAAAAGVVVNTALVVFLDDSLFMLVFLSAFAFLLSTRLVGDEASSMLTALHSALTKGTWM